MTANDERIADYLDGLDSFQAIDDAFPPSFDEWNAILAATGRKTATWGNYLSYLNRRGQQVSHDTLTYFGAVDDDDYIPDGDGE